MTIQAFFDESADDPREPAFVMAGWVSEAGDWSPFCDAWKAASEAGPKIRYFKHHEAMGMSGEFEGWQPRDRNEKVLQLTRVICESRLSYGVVTSFRHQLYEALVQGWRPPRNRLKEITTIRSPYAMCFHTTLAAVLQRQVMLGVADQVDFIFDSRNDSLKKCISLYLKSKSKFNSEAIRNVAGSVVAADDKITPALQAADMLAGQFLATLRAGKNAFFFNELAKRKTICENLVSASDLSWIRAALKKTGLVPDDQDTR